MSNTASTAKGIGVGGGAVALSGLVDYGAESIVSRTIIDKPVGTVTLFAFDKGQGLSEHQAPFDALVQVVEGKAEVTIGGEASVVGAGEVIVMPANVGHAVRAEERFKMLLTMIKQV